MSHILISFFSFIIAISILVTFHEWGHFWVARYFGVKVLRFSVGFGKPLWRWQDKHHTEYVIAAIPLGGYVKMLDEREAPVVPKELPFAFNRQPVGVRFLIVFAGPLFNFIFAILAYWLMYTIGISGWVPKIGEILPDSIAMHSGMQKGQEIIQIDKEDTATWQQVFKQLMSRYGDADVLEIQTKTQDGSVQNYYLNLSKWKLKNEKEDLLRSIGIEPYLPPIPPVIADVVKGEPADKAGIVKGDKILVANQRPIKEWKDFTNIIFDNVGKHVSVVIERNHQKKEVIVTPRARKAQTGEAVGYVGLVVNNIEMPDELIRKERLGPWDALMAATQKTYEYTIITLKLLVKLMTGSIGLNTISGPISIAQGAGIMVSVGLQYYAGFLAVISIGLGVLNLLPIPILDGGHLLYFVIEMFTGRPVPERIQIYGFKIGILLLTLLMGIGFYNDIIRLF